MVEDERSWTSGGSYIERLGKLLGDLIDSKDDEVRFRVLILQMIKDGKLLFGWGMSWMRKKKQKLLGSWKRR